jgi:two-component system cell cycle response regulator
LRKFCSDCANFIGVREPTLRIFGMHASLAVLTTLTQDMLDAKDCQTRLQLVTDVALRLAPAADHASVRLSRGDSLQVGARSGVGRDHPARGFKKGEGILGWVAEHGHGVRVADSQRDPRFHPSNDRGFVVGSLVSVPIRARGTTLGVLSLSAAECNAFTDEDEALANLLAQTAAQALITSELERRAVTDAQTQAFNRGYLFPRLNQELERARTRGAPLSLLLIDLDHFKRINDRYGHPVGDQVLCAFADVVRSCVRSTDVLVRRGGEEFVLIMPGTRECFAVAVAERVRMRAAAAPLVVQEAMRVDVTISVGVASWDGRESAEALDARADGAMYEAKQSGRNRTVRCTGPRHNLQLCGSVG